MMSRQTILFGTHIYHAQGDAARRQRRAAATLVDAAADPPINLQFTDGANLCEIAGFETQPVLELDSNRITGRRGPRKPIVHEMFTQLARLAIERGSRCFGFSNGDILMSSTAVDRIMASERRAYVIARTDVDAGGVPDSRPLLYGTDVFVVDAAWWLAHSHRFRPYVIGDACWDNVYTAQLLCTAGGLLLNREPLVHHEKHAIVWKDSPFAEHNGYLAALDRLYFSRWVLYVDRLDALRQAAGGLASIEDELALQEEIFRDWRPRLWDRVLQALRVTKLEVRRKCYPSPRNSDAGS